MALAQTQLTAELFRFERFESRRDELLGYWLLAADEIAREAFGYGAGRDEPEQREESNLSGVYDGRRTRQRSYPTPEGELSAEASLSEYRHPRDGEVWGISLRVLRTCDAQTALLLASWGPAMADAISISSSDFPGDPVALVRDALARAVG